MNRRTQPVYSRRKRKAEALPSLAEEESPTVPEEKRVKHDEDAEGEGCEFYKQQTHHFYFHADEDVITPPSSEGADTLEIQIRPHPQHTSLNRMAIKNLVTSPACTIAHLLRFIKLNMDSEALGKPI